MLFLEILGTQRDALLQALSKKRPAMHPPAGNVAPPVGRGASPPGERETAGGTRPAWVAHAAALAIVAAALLVRWLLDPIMGRYFPFLPAYVAVGVVVWRYGYRPAIMAAVFGLAGSLLLFVGRWQSNEVLGAYGWATTVAFIIGSALMIAFGEAFRHARQRSRAMTERDTIERALQRSQERMIVASRAGRLFTWEHDFSTRTVRWSETAADVLECALSELPSDSDRAYFFVDKADRKAAIRGFREALRRHTENYTVELRGQGKNAGKYFLSHTHIRYDTQGHPVQTYGVTQDITPLKLAQLAEGALAAIVQTSHDAIYSSSADGLIASWNVSAASLYGYSAEQIIGQPEAVLQPPRPERGGVAEAARADGGTATTDFETWHVRRDGTRFPVSVTRSPIHDRAGNVVGWSTIARDVSERKEAERTLEESRQRLELAMDAGKMGSWEWNLVTNEVKYYLVQLNEFVDEPAMTPLSFQVVKEQDGSFAARIQTFGIARHPAQLYEAISCLILFAFFLWYWSRYKVNLPEGRIFGMFMIALWSLRFVYEFLKENQVQFEDQLKLNMGQMLSIPLIIVGILVLVRSFKKPVTEIQDAS